MLVVLIQKNAINYSEMRLLYYIPLILPSRFGLSVVESFACGTPVVAFNKGSMPEIISDGKNGFLVSTIDEACIRSSKIFSY